MEVIRYTSRRTRVSHFACCGVLKAGSFCAWTEITFGLLAAIMALTFVAMKVEEAKNSGDFGDYRAMWGVGAGLISAFNGVLMRQGIKKNNTALIKASAAIFSLSLTYTVPAVAVSGWSAVPGLVYSIVALLVLRAVHGTIADNKYKDASDEGTFGESAPPSFEQLYPALASAPEDIV